MKRRALAIGAGLELPASGPAAENVDVERVAEMLSRRGFEVDRLQGPAATRDGILAGYRRLAGALREGDAAVVYYSGHGGMVKVGARGDGAPLPTWLQYIAPTDFDETTEDDFRGVSAWELSLLLEELTAKTDNVTVILDCCHAAQMSRSHATTGAAPRAIRRPIRIDAGKHYDRVHRDFGPIARLPQRGNPRAVRLAACGEWQSAFPTSDDQGRPTGLFTHELLATLDEVGEAEVSWQVVGAAVRTRVLRRAPTQRPMVEGPAHRRLFSTLQAARSRSCSSTRSSGSRKGGSPGSRWGTCTG
ncbi:MAG TPA: caspase family protein [Kofleriaceae bacterium]|nr:caspase family protein [Kofleriaceae bacterium]